MTASSHLEVERTWEIAPGLDLPDLSGVSPVAAVRVLADERLDATYLDTADLKLARARITLRRRSGGRDAGWHLKLPATGDAREELHRPSRGTRSTTPPRELAALVRSRTRGARLVPVVRLQTERRVVQLLDADERVLAEVADDTVSGQVLLEPPDTVLWREVEVELVEGDAALLDDLGAVLAAAGAVPAVLPSKLARTLGGRMVPDLPARLPARATAGQALVVHLREQAEELLARDPAVRRDLPDSVHKMRVATRRLRSALTSFRPLLERGTTDPLREELKHLAGVLGQARDAEVLQARLRRAVDSLPSDLVLGPVPRRIDDDLGRRHREAHKRVVAQLDSARHRALLDALERLVTAPPLSAAASRPAGPELRRHVRRSWRRLERAVAKAQAAPTAAEREHLLHDARKAAKRTRYAAEAAAPVLGKRSTRLAQRVEAVQEVLGEHQDSVVTREELRRLGAGAHGAGENGFTFGLLHAREVSRGDDATDSFDRVWARAYRPKVVRWLT
jgi:CHAD domain-containing protein